MKKTTIRKKLLTLMIWTSFLLGSLFAVVNVFYMHNIRNEIEVQNGELGKKTAEESSDRLLSKTIDQLISTANGISEYSNEKFSEVESETKIVAAYVKSIYENKNGVYSSATASPYGFLTQQEYDDNVKETPRKPIIHIKADSTGWNASAGKLTDAAQKELNLVSPAGNILYRTVETSDIVAACYIGSANGFQLSADCLTTPVSVQSVKFGGTGGIQGRDWYLAAEKVKEGEAAWTKIFLDNSGRGASLTCATPVYDGTGKLRAVVASGNTMGTYSKKVTSATLGESGRSFIVNHDGEIIITADAIHFDGNTPQYRKLTDEGDDKIKEAAVKMAAGERGYVIGKYQGKDVLVAYSPIKLQPWTFVTMIDMDEVLVPANKISDDIVSRTNETVAVLNNTISRSRLLIVIIIVLALLVVVLLSFRFSEQLTGPLRALTEGVKKAGAGDLDTRINPGSNDETQILADAFNKMAQDLKEYIKNLATVTKEKERIGAELHVATTIQASMLPSIFPPFPGRPEFDLYASMTPAKEVGGDFYDFFLVDEDHLALVIADVSGKGVPAALFMVIAKTLIKNSAQSGLSPAAVLEKVNQQLCENNEAEMFVTVWIGIMKISEGTMKCANAGHEYPAISRKDGPFEILKDKHGFVVAGMPGAKYREYEISLSAGDTLFVYTDGVAEATNAKNELYGTDRMLSALNKVSDKRPADMLPAVKEDINAFVGSAPQFDDITMLVMKMNEWKQ